MSLEKKLGLFVAPVLVALVSGLAVPLLLRAASRDPRQPGLALAGIQVRANPARIDLTVSNRSTTVAVIGRVDLDVRLVEHLRRCSGIGVFSPPVYEGSSHIYDFDLPNRPGVVQVPTSQKIAPNDADAFSLEELNPPAAPTLYQLHLSLYHDGLADPVDAGNVVLATPMPREADVAAHATNPTQGRCLADNRRVLTDVLALDGARSPELTRLGQSLD